MEEVMQKEAITFDVKEQFGAHFSSVSAFREAFVEALARAARESKMVILDTSETYGFTPDFIDAAFGGELTKLFNERVGQSVPIKDYIAAVLPGGSVITLLIENKLETGKLMPERNYAREYR